MNAYKFENERLDKQIGSVKELYFNSKQSQAIQEEMEGENMEMDQMGGYNAGGMGMANPIMGN